MQLHLPTILAFLPLILAAPMADHQASHLADAPTPTSPTPGEISILPFPNPITNPSPNPTASFQDLLAFCASGSTAASLPAIQQFCKLISGFAGGAGGLGGGLGGIIPGLPAAPGLPLPLPLPLPAGTGPILPV